MPSSPLGLPLQAPVGAEISLRVDERHDLGGADRADQLVLEIFVADVEAQPLHVRTRLGRADAGSDQTPPDDVLLANVAQARQFQSSSRGTKSHEVTRNPVCTARRQDHHALRIEVPAMPDGKRLDRDLVADALDKDDGARGRHLSQCPGRSLGGSRRTVHITVQQTAGKLAAPGDVHWGRSVRAVKHTEANACTTISQAGRYDADLAKEAEQLTRKGSCQALASSPPGFAPLAEVAWLLSGLGVADTLHHGLQQRPSRLRMLHSEGTEYPRYEQQTAQVRFGRDCRRTDGVVDQRHLSETVTWAKDADWLSVYAHRRLPVHNDAESGATLLFLNGQGRTRRKRPVMRGWRAAQLPSLGASRTAGPSRGPLLA